MYALFFNMQTTDKGIFFVEYFCGWGILFHIDFFSDWDIHWKKFFFSFLYDVTDDYNFFLFRWWFLSDTGNFQSMSFLEIV